MGQWAWATAEGQPFWEQESKHSGENIYYPLGALGYDI